jgi:hypothetical protein
MNHTIAHSVRVLFNPDAAHEGVCVLRVAQQTCSLSNGQLYW